MFSAAVSGMVLQMRNGTSFLLVVAILLTTVWFFEVGRAIQHRHDLRVIERAIEHAQDIGCNQEVEK